ncbi:hypothetical protein QUC31_010374 [Theobroma cacao]
MEERSSSSCAIGVPVYAATAPGLPADVRVQAPPLPRLLFSETRVTANTDHRIPNDQRSKKSIFLLVLASLTTVIAFHISVRTLFRPSRPKFGLYSLSVSRFNISGSGEITADWDVGFLARNPNGVLWSTYSCNRALVSVYYKNQLLSEGVFPEIRLPSKETKSYTAKAVALGKRIDDSQVADDIASDWSQGVVAFTVRLLDASEGSGINNVNVTCSDIKVAFSNHSSSQGTMLVGPQGSPNNTDRQAITRCSSLR